MIQEDISKKHRQRVLFGMARAAAGKGYANTTIADIAREAGVSRRTFYEHFSSKEQCFIALYEGASITALKVFRAAIDPAKDWQTQLEQAMLAYLDWLAQDPTLMRTLFVDILGLGPEGRNARRRINEQLAGFMLDVVNGEPPHGASATVLSPALAMAVIGGINELMLHAVECDQASTLAGIAAPALELIRAITRR